MAVGTPPYSCSCQVDEEKKVVFPALKTSQKSQWPELNHLGEKGRKTALRSSSYVESPGLQQVLAVKLALLHWLQLIGVGTRTQIKTTMGTPDMKKASLDGKLVWNCLVGTCWPVGALHDKWWHKDQIASSLGGCTTQMEGSHTGSGYVPNGADPLLHVSLSSVVHPWLGSPGILRDTILEAMPLSCILVVNLLTRCYLGGFLYQTFKSLINTGIMWSL